MLRSDKTLKVLAVLIGIAMVAAITVIVASLRSSHSPVSQPSVIQTQPSQPVDAIVKVAQPPTSAQVAAAEHCGNYHAEKSAAGAAFGMIIDGGYCYIGETKYTVRTFQTTAVRDAWLKSAEDLGVHPKWETPTSVTYPYVAS